MLDEREFELINIIGGDLGANQRVLSRRMNLSLGMTNLLIRRLVTKGYIRIRQLNKKKVEYLLTPKGFTEKMRKSVNYTVKTIYSISLIKNSLLSIVKNSYDQGARVFYILGGADLAGLIEMVMSENLPHDYKTIRINEIPHELLDGIVLICREGELILPMGVRGVNVIAELAQNEALIALG